MQRAEKKAAQRRIEGSETGSESSAMTSHMLNESQVLGDADGPTGALGIWSHCIAILQQHKLRVLVGKLEQLGFPEWQACAAVAR